MLLTFEAPEAVVRAHLPARVEPDRWQGRTHVSLVALEMSDIRVHGWSVPGFLAHPQVNFRCYVRHGPHAAVWFVRELVPSRVIAAVGRLWYGEPFRTAPIALRAADSEMGRDVEYRFGTAAPPCRIAVTGSRDGLVPAASTLEHYLKERAYGVRTDRHGRLRAFRVEHPPWAVRKIVSLDYRVDFGALYGPEWEFLNRSRPVSTIFAVGSDVSVYPP